MSDDLNPQIRCERGAPGPLTAIRLESDGRAVLEFVDGESAITLADLRWLCLVAGPAVLVGPGIRASSGA